LRELDIEPGVNFFKDCPIFLFGFDLKEMRLVNMR